MVRASFVWFAVGAALLTFWAGEASAQAPESQLMAQPSPERNAGAHQPMNGPEAGAKAADAGQEDAGGEAPQSALAAIEKAINALSSEVTHAIVGHAETAEEQQDAKADLKAQQEMALWALCVAAISGGQLVLTLVGIILLWKTLRATRDAVTEAEKATTAANAAVDVTKRSAENQLRAYVFAESATLHDMDSPPHFIINLHNTGATPAYRLKTWVGVEYCEKKLSSFLHVASSKGEMELPVVDMGANGKRNIKYTHLGYSSQDYNCIRSKDTFVYLFGGIEYRDCFGTERRGFFKFVYALRPGGRGDFEMRQAN
jgi:hypothetical protein